MNSEAKNPGTQTKAERLLEQAYNYKEADEFENALRECDAAIRIDPSLAEAHNLRGIALEELGRKDEAVKAYRQAIVLDPQFREAEENLSDLEAGLHLEQAYSYKDADKFEDVLREADAAIKIDPSLAEAHNLRGIALEELGREDEAVKAYRQAIVLAPEFREAKNNLSELDARPHLEQAYSYKDADKFEDVLRKCDVAIQIDPSLAEAHNLRGIALEELGRDDEAVKAYRKAIVLAPEFREAEENLSALESDLAEEGRLVTDDEQQLVTDDEHQLITVDTFTSPAEVKTAKTVLDNKGIWSCIAYENIQRTYPVLTSSMQLKLQVRQSDADRALELLYGKPEVTDMVNDEPAEAEECEELEEIPIHESPIVRYEKSRSPLSFFKKRK